MLVAWILLAGIVTVLPRYFRQGILQKTVIGVQAWFQVGNREYIYTTQNLLGITFSFNDLMLKTNRQKKDFFLIKIG